MCADPIYKHDIRKATIVFDPSEKLFVGTTSDDEVAAGNEVTFRLIVRNKSNINLKRKVYISGVDS